MLCQRISLFLLLSYVCPGTLSSHSTDNISTFISTPLPQHTDQTSGNICNDKFLNKMRTYLSHNLRAPYVRRPTEYELPFIGLGLVNYSVYLLLGRQLIEIPINNLVNHNQKNESTFYHHFVSMNQFVSTDIEHKFPSLQMVDYRKLLKFGISTVETKTIFEILVEMSKNSRLSIVEISQYRSISQTKPTIDYSYVQNNQGKMLYLRHDHQKHLVQFELIKKQKKLDQSFVLATSINNTNTSNSRQLMVYFTKVSSINETNKSLVNQNQLLEFSGESVHGFIHSNHLYLFDYLYVYYFPFDEAQFNFSTEPFNLTKLNWKEFFQCGDDDEDDINKIILIVLISIGVLLLLCSLIAFGVSCCRNYHLNRDDILENVSADQTIVDQYQRNQNPATNPYHYRPMQNKCSVNSSNSSTPTRSMDDNQCSANGTDNIGDQHDDLSDKRLKRRKKRKHHQQQQRSGKRKSPKNTRSRQTSTTTTRNLNEYNNKDNHQKDSNLLPSREALSGDYSRSVSWDNHTILKGGIKDTTKTNSNRNQQKQKISKIQIKDLKNLNSKFVEENKFRENSTTGNVLSDHKVVGKLVNLSNLISMSKKQQQQEKSPKKSPQVTRKPKARTKRTSPNIRSKHLAWLMEYPEDDNTEVKIKNEKLKSDQKEINQQPKQEKSVMKKVMQKLSFVSNIFGFVSGIQAPSREIESSLSSSSSSSNTVQATIENNVLSKEPERSNSKQSPSVSQTPKLNDSILLSDKLENETLTPIVTKSNKILDQQSIPSPLKVVGAGKSLEKTIKQQQQEEPPQSKAPTTTTTLNDNSDLGLLKTKQTPQPVLRNVKLVAITNDGSGISNPLFRSSNRMVDDPAQLRDTYKQIHAKMTQLTDRKGEGGTKLDKQNKQPKSPSTQSPKP